MVIRSDELPKTQGEVARMFGDVTVVLCTLSMLSNPKLKECGLIRVIPVTSLVIDEASQIDVFEFMVISVDIGILWAINDLLCTAPLLQILRRSYKSLFLWRP